MEEVICKVCSTKLDLSKSYYCPECGFEIHIYPEPPSSELEIYEKERIKKYKEQREKQIELSSTMEKLERYFEEKQDSDQRIINDLTEKLQKAEKVNEDVSSQLTEARDRLEERENALDKEQRKRREAESKVANTPKIDGFVHIVNTYDGGETILPVFHGVNTYGSANSDYVNHHKINLRVRGLKIDDKHFAVEKKVNGRMVVRPLGDARLVCEGSDVPRQGRYAEVHQPIFIGNNIKIIISTF